MHRHPENDRLIRMFSALFREWKACFRSTAFGNWKFAVAPACRRHRVARQTSVEFSRAAPLLYDTRFDLQQKLERKDIFVPREPLFNRLDHIAIVVRDTDEALLFYRDTLGLPLILSEEIPSGGVRLTHLDMGNVQLQLVQPLTDDHPLRQHLEQNGEGLHHLCFETDDVAKTLDKLPERNLAARSPTPHDAPKGRKAGFIDPETTRGVLWEMTADPKPNN